MRGPDDDLRWLREQLQPPRHLDPPIRLHRSRPWTDADGRGSLLGSPALSRAFERRLDHDWRSGAMGRALGQIHGANCPPELPRLDEMIEAVAAARGNADAAISALAARHPAMADPERARSHLGRALRELRGSHERIAARLLAQGRAA